MGSTEVAQPIEALNAIQAQQKKSLAEQYAGKQSNQFVAELKNSTLFQFNWGELLSAAPTALALMGSIWIAAANPKADEISLVDSMPIGGFKNLTNFREPTLRSCLVDVCNNGGRKAFGIAGANMAALQIRSQRITAERITLVFQRLGPCTQSDDALEDFKDALKDFADEARDCARLATETRVAFSNWGLMVGELHACSENKVGAVSRERASAAVQQDMAKIEEKFANKSADEAVKQVEYAKTQMAKAEQRLNTALDKVPGPWESLAQTAVSGFTQAMPSIISGVLPAVLAAANPASALTGALGSALKGPNAPLGGQLNGVLDAAKQNGSTSAPAASPAPPTTNDPAYAAAVGMRELITNFYDFLGGEKGTCDWSKFTVAGAGSAAKPVAGASGETPNGITYFLGNLKGQKAQVTVTDTEPNKKLMDGISKAMTVATEIQEKVSASGFKAEAVTADTITAWKANIKIAKDEILQLASAGTSLSSGSSPNAFANLNIKIPPTDYSAQTAQVSAAAQAAQMAQTAADAAQNNYEASIQKQAQTQAAMLEVQQKLKSLQEKGKTLDEIKSVLRDCISVLVDLSVQVAKLETFFTMITTVIDNIVLVRADDFVKNMGKGAERSRRNGYLTFDELSKQTIYTSTLQLKAYFSLLEDIALMYTQIDVGYVKPGMQLCMRLAKGDGGNEDMPRLAEELGQFSQDSCAAVKKLVDEKQQSMLKGLRERAANAAASTQLIETTVKDSGMAIDKAASDAIARGGADSNKEARAVLNAANSTTASESDTVDCSQL